MSYWPGGSRGSLSDCPLPEKPLVKPAMRVTSQVGHHILVQARPAGGLDLSAAGQSSSTKPTKQCVAMFLSPTPSTLGSVLLTNPIRPAQIGVAAEVPRRPSLSR